MLIIKLSLTLTLIIMLVLKHTFKFVLTLRPLAFKLTLTLV